jgi:hypothetical protein
MISKKLVEVLDRWYLENLLFNQKNFGDCGLMKLFAIIFGKN